MRHLDFAFGETLSASEKRAIAKRIAWNLGLVVAEVLAASRGKLPKDYIDYSDVDARKDQILGDYGFVGLTGHLGNWELCGASMRRFAPDRVESVIAKRLGNPGLNDLVEELRARLGMKTFYQNEAPMHLVRMLREGRAIGTVPDQDVARIAGEFVPFFGRDAYTPTGPAILAIQGRVPIIVAYMQRTKRGLRFCVHDPIWPDRNDRDRKREALRLTRAWSEVLEAAIREQPADWMWFHKRWETTPERLEARRLARMSEAERKARA